MSVNEPSKEPWLPSQSCRFRPPSSVPLPARAAVLATLALLYTAQGVPFGLASEYLPVVLRQAHYSRTQIAAVFWLQLPWQLKVLWAGVADRPGVRARSRGVLLMLQLALATLIGGYALFDVHRSAAAWFALTAFCALVAATQDVFVDALAVRALAPADRGYGNVAQVAGYRLGMLAGGAGLLLAAGAWGQAPTLLACAAAVGLVGAGAFALRGTDDAGGAPSNESDHAHAPSPGAAPLGLGALLRVAFGSRCWPVLALAATFKLGPHVAASLIKPMLVDHHWSGAQIGWAAVTVGTFSALLGAAAGGWVYRVLGEGRALGAALVFQALACLPLVGASLAGTPLGLTTAAIATEHLASGLGTTVLFAALMSATMRASAGLHYTVLTSANALAIGLGGLLGGVLGDALGEWPAFVLAAGFSLLPSLLLPRWEQASRASAHALQEQALPRDAGAVVNPRSQVR